MRSVRSVWNFARGRHPSLPAWPSSELRKVRKRWATAPRKTRTIPDALLPAWRKQVAALERDDVRDFILLMHFTGMRVGEVRALDVAHVNIRTGIFLVADPKNGTPVELPIVRQVKPILRRRLEAVKEGPLFPFGDVRKSHASVDAAPWSYHDLRRQYVTAAHRAGIDDLIARRLTNHATPDDDAHAGYVVLDADGLRSHAQTVADWLVARGKAKAR
jgi:integrase